MKHRQRPTALLAMVLVASLWAACTKMALVNAPREREGLDPVQHAHYDAGSKIRYMVSNDNARIYLRFDTDNYRTIMCARKYGVTIHLDKEGKKKAPYYLHYPTYAPEDVAGIVVPEEGMVVMGGLNRDLFPPSTSAIWHAGEETRTIDLSLADEGFMGSVGIDERGVMVYRVAIPIARLGVQRPEELADLRMMLEVPASDPNEKNDNTSMSGSSSMPGSSVTSPMPGNTMSGNTMGSTMGGTPMPTPRSNGGPTNTRIWMEVKLSPSSQP